MKKTILMIGGNRGIGADLRDQLLFLTGIILFNGPEMLKAPPLIIITL